MVRFIHTADWQIGKPYARVVDSDKRARLRQERIEAIKRIGEVVRGRKAAFVLVAGDLFDSPTPDKSTVSSFCAAIGAIGVPVLAIPGNHDHAGPGTIWEQEFFLREQQNLAPLFRLLNNPKPVEESGVVILPCPLTRNHESGDTTAWLRDPKVWTQLPDDKPRVVLAHGSVQGFSSVSDGEESSGQSNLIELSALDPLTFDYIALGDWHGTKQVSPKAWYSGTPELDRFLKGGDHNPGKVLCVEIPARGQTPTVDIVSTAILGWHDVTFTLVDESSLPHLEAKLTAVLGSRTQQDLLRLELNGSLGFAGDGRLRKIVESLEARLIRLKLQNKVQVLPSDAEIEQLTGRAGDPLISEIAIRLVEEQRHGGTLTETAHRALRELYVAVEDGGSRV